MAGLVEARRDGRLGDREEASLERHLGTCAACRALERELDEVRALLRRPVVPPPTPLEHQRGRLLLLRAAAAPPGPSRRRAPRLPRPPRLSVVAVAALLVAGVARVSIPRSPAGHDGGRPQTSGSAPVLVARHLPPIVLPRVAATAAGLEVTETTVHGSASARFERRTAGKVERVALAEGTLDLTVRKLSPDERFLVVTDDAEVEVRGTAFEVEAHAGRIARVAVREGKVEVRYRSAISLVPAGGAWQPPSDAVGVAAPPPPPTPRPTAPSTPREPDGRREASRAFGDAVDLLGRGDYAAARSRLDAFRAAHPTDGRADLAAFLEIVSLQRAGRRTEAQEAARRYLELYPNGDRRAEAALVASGR
jgi:ferric-dicitrate binding protein FerR (iron transport regulator)